MAMFMYEKLGRKSFTSFHEFLSIYDPTICLGGVTKKYLKTRGKYHVGIPFWHNELKCLVELKI